MKENIKINETGLSLMVNELLLGIYISLCLSAFLWKSIK